MPVTKITSHAVAPDQQTPISDPAEASQDLQSNAKSVLDNRGACVETGGSTDDIAGRKAIEHQLAESEARFRMIFDQSPVGKAIVGLDKRFIRCNAAFCLFLGYFEHELIGKTISDSTHPEDLGLGMPELKRLVVGAAEAATVQKRYVRKDGAIVCGEIKIGLVRNEQNEPLYFLPVIQDITSRMQAEEAVKKTGALFRAMIDNAPLGAHLYELMPDNRLVFFGANRSADRILLVDNGQFVGKPTARLRREQRLG